MPRGRVWQANLSLLLYFSASVAWILPVVQYLQDKTHRHSWHPDPAAFCFEDMGRRCEVFSRAMKGAGSKSGSLGLWVTLHHLWAPDAKWQNCSHDHLCVCLRLLWDMCVHAKSLQWCPTLCDPVGHSPPGFSVHRIFQAWILEWVVVPSSRWPSQPRNWTHVSYVSCIGRQVLYH